MGILGNISSLGYSRISEWDPEEKKHREAQFLIYKAMKQADRVIISSRRRKPSWLVRFRVTRLKVKIGTRFMRLRKSVAVGLCNARTGFCRQVWGHLFNAASSPTAAVVGLPHPFLS